MLISRKISVGNGVTERYAIAGNYIFIADTGFSTGYLLISTDNDDVIEMRVGDEVYLKPFTNIFITQLEAVPVAVKIVVGNGEERYRSSSVFGSVSVINGEVQRVKRGRCFFASDNVAGSAGQYTHSQLYNPPASGRNLVLSKAIVSGAAGIYAASLYAAPLSVSVSGSVGNKLTASALVTVAELRKANDPANLGNGFQFTSLAVANDVKEILFEEPVVIQPNTGFIVRNNTLAASLLVNYQYYEELL